MRAPQVLTVFLFTLFIYCVSAGPDYSRTDYLLKDDTVDKENHNLVDDIVQFVVHKIKNATEAVGAGGVLDPDALQLYVTNALSMGTEWLTEKTGSLYEKIRDRVSHWWSGVGGKAGAPAGSQEETPEEIKRKVMKKILTQIEKEMKLQITGVDEENLEKLVVPVVRKFFADLFGFPPTDGKYE